MDSGKIDLNTIAQSRISYRITCLEQELQEYRELSKFLDKDPNAGNMLYRFSKITDGMGLKPLS